MNQPSSKFEITFNTKEMAKFEIDMPEKDQRVVYVAKKVFIPPERTFFQKYGSYFIIGLSLIVQVCFIVIIIYIKLVMTNMNQNMAA